MSDPIHPDTPWEWLKLAAWGKTGEAAEPEWTGAVYCSVCGSCPPEALEKALDDGLEAQWCKFLDTVQDDLCFYTEELPSVTYEQDSADRASRLYYKHVQTYVLAHLWGMEPDDRKRVLDKLVVATDADPTPLYEQFGVDRD